MDSTDKKILKILAEKSVASATEIGNAVNLSVPAVNKRIAKLSGENIIKSYSIITDAEKVNKPIIAFILVVFNYNENDNALFNYINSDADVLECYSVSGEYDYLIKVCAKDVKSLENKILSIKKRKGVVRSHTMLSLMENKYKPAILPDDEERKI